MSLTHRAALGAAVLATTVGAASASAASTTALKASLRGAAEAPQKGDPDGKGRATVRIKGTKLCYSLSLSKVDPVMAGHIHRGKAGEAGEIVVPLFMGKAVRSGCVTVKSSLAKEIARHPSRFYANVHNAKYPAGALRGQLKKG